MKLYIVMHKSGSGVAFQDRDDAIYAAYGIGNKYFGVDPIADNFRETHDEHRKFPMLEIDLTMEQEKALKLKVRKS